MRLCQSLDELQGPDTPLDNHKQGKGYPIMPLSSTPSSSYTGAHVLGADVAKDSVVFHDSRTNHCWSCNNSPKALKKALAGLRSIDLLVCEATGGYEATLLCVAHELGIPIHCADLRKVHAFARSLRSHGKTDPLDAAMLARYGEERRERLLLWSPPLPEQQALAKLVRLRCQLVQTRGDYTRRAKAPEEGTHRHHITALVKAITKQISEVDQDISHQIKKSQNLTQTIKTIEAIKGCGTVTAYTLAALMPELGHLSRRQAASLAGLAPHPKQSGKNNAYRSVRGGRQEIKTVMFMAAMAARRFNPECRITYERLIQNGKKPIVAVTAIARKLITIINAKLKETYKLKLS